MLVALRQPEVKEGATTSTGATTVIVQEQEVDCPAVSVAVKVNWKETPLV